MLRQLYMTDMPFQLTRAQRVHNALTPIIDVTGQYLHYRGRDTLPKRFRYAYTEAQRDVLVYAWPGLHLVLRAANWWRYARWCLERLATRHGANIAKGQTFDRISWSVPSRPEDRQ